MKYPIRFFKLFCAFIVLALLSYSIHSQNIVSLSNPEAQQILLGSYDPSLYQPAVVVNQTDSVLHGIVNQVSADTMFSWLARIDSYYNRNTGSDTLSQVRGIGAVRRWIYGKFLEFSQMNENRLIVTYMNFDFDICGQPRHRNVLAVLPGLDTTQKEILLVEGHYDTRCQGACDTNCYTPGMEDNGSGTVLVMELARIMSRFAFNNTIVFACVTGEDQGLNGAWACANWLYSKDVPVRACFNNDVIGGIICGNTSSPPGCPGLNAIDSTHVRIFSYSQNNDSSKVSQHKQLARYVRLHQEERINPLLTTPMNLVIHIYVDRTGRSGDHIPFQQRNYTALRFCSMNEHGNGSGTPPDRQHTSDDILGVDLSIPPDGVLDSFFVDRGYLRRNTIMNGVNLGWLALAPPSPQPQYQALPDGISIKLTGSDSAYQHYRVGIRSKGSGSLYFDTVYTITNTSEINITGLDPGKRYFISVANVRNQIESLFSPEYSLVLSGIPELYPTALKIRLLPCQPNPFDHETTFIIEAAENADYPEAEIVIMDITGRTVSRLPFSIIPGTNKISYHPPFQGIGFYTFTLKVNGAIVATRKMIRIGQGEGS